jgi:ferrous iron transport protein B
MQASPPRTRVAALVGNPNTGKTTLFNALSGLRHRTGNYPGVTVESKKGTMTCGGRSFELIDLPGTYSLAPRSPDEMVAVDVILGEQQGESRPDVVVSIVDASNLDRNLYLTSQVMELGVPVVVALNMIDVAEAHGIHIDVETLSHNLGVPVVAIQANKGVGLDRLREVLAATADDPPLDESLDTFDANPTPAGDGIQSAEAVRRHRRGAPFPPAFEQEVALLHKELGGTVSRFLVRRLILDVGGFTEQRLTDQFGEGIKDRARAARERLAAAGCAVPAVEARSRYAWIRNQTAGCVRKPDVRHVTWTDRIDHILTNKLWGTLAFLVLMFLVFQSIFTWARPLMKVIDDSKDTLAELLKGKMPAGPFTDLLLDGVLKGVGAVLVFLPQILILFAFIAVLEDCGYMARAAFLMDKLMSRCGLSGKSFIPMLSSLACAVPGIMATRVIENRRDRLATILVAPLMSCSARLPVYVLLIGAFLTRGYAWWVPGVTMFAMYAIGLVVAPLVALVLKRTLLRGETPAFVMEMPLYKVPSLHTVGRRVVDSAWAFVRRAGTVILATMVLVWALLYFPHTDVNGVKYGDRIAKVEEEVEGKEQQQKAVNAIQYEWKRESYLGRAGRWMEPAFTPLGWDWRIGVAALASFPAREVVVGTLGIVYQVGQVDSDEIRESKDVAGTELGGALREGKLGVPGALSLMVFFALCCQCASTLAVIRRETKSWGWPAFTFTYMTVLAYVAALVVFQVASRIV